VLIACRVYHYFIIIIIVTIKILKHSVCCVCVDRVACGIHLFIYLFIYLCRSRFASLGGACLLRIQTIRLLEVVDGHVDTHVLLARNQHQRVRLCHDRVLTAGGREREAGGRKGGREGGRE
jgi:hypothetical protein